MSFSIGVELVVVLHGATFASSWFSVTAQASLPCYE